MFVKNIMLGEERKVGVFSHAWLLSDVVGYVGHFGLTHLEPHDSIPANTHIYDEVFFIISGSGIVSLSGQSQMVETGSVVYIPAGAEHEVKACDDLLEMLFINLDT